VKSEYYDQYYELEDNYWWFVGMRHIFRRCIKNMLKDYRTDKEDIRILDIGCGPGRMIMDLEDFGNVVGVDNKMKPLESCKRRGINKLVLGNGVKLPFKDKSLDLVTSFNVIEHIDDDSGFIREINRVVKDNGWIIISTAAYNFLWSQHDVVNEHKRRYIKRGLKNIIGKHCDIKKISYLNCFLFPFIWVGIKVVNLLNSNSNNTSCNASCGFYPVPHFLNKILASILWVESVLLQKLNFPFGVSLLCIAKKSKKLS